METIVIYPGRFHPFHKGHKASYDFLTQKFGQDSVYVVSSGRQAPITSPFSFEQKTKMMSALGIPSNKIAMVKNPYRADEITKNFDPDNTVLVFAVSDKDMQRFTFTKKDGTPGYIQPLTKDPKPMKDNAYLVVTPTVSFTVLGKTIKSASEIRAQYVKSSDADRQQIIQDLYGKLDDSLKEMFDSVLSINESFLKEGKYSHRLKMSLKVEHLMQQLERYWIHEAEHVDMQPTQGQEPPQIQPGYVPGDYEYVNMAKLVPVQTVRHKHKHFKAYKRIRSGQYTPIVIDINYRIINGHHRYDMAKKMGLRGMQCYKIHDTIDSILEGWSEKYKKSIDCSNPKGFSQKAHCAGRKKKKSK